MSDAPEPTSEDDVTSDHAPVEIDEELGRQMRRYARVGRILLDRKPDDGTDDPDFGREVVPAARRAKAMAVLAEQVAVGRPVDEALVVTVRALTDAGQWRAARSLALGLEQTHGRLLTDVVMGQVLFSVTEYKQAWEFFRNVEVDDLARLVPLEAVTGALTVRSPESVAVAEQIAARADTFDTFVLVKLAGRFLVTGHQSLAEELVERARARDLEQAGERCRALLENLGQWTYSRPVLEPHAGVTIGVMDYHQVDLERASRNLGDYIQTLAMLGNLARFTDVRFSGADGIGELVSGLQDAVQPGLRLGGEADVRLLPVSRDFSQGGPVPEGTWMLGFGWHMHSTFRLGFGLPYHPNLHPLFVSFHINLLDALTPEALDYLRVHGPIGCRDWTTVDVLLSAGVDAFFSGCLTTTVDAVFPPTDEVTGDGPKVVGAVDLPDFWVRRIGGPSEELTHMGTEHRQADLVTGVRAAQELLDTYQHRFRRVVTSRLHSYLPATSLGLDVRFRPTVDGDVRFDGLADLHPGKPAFTRMRDGIRELLAETFGLILGGAPPEEVYARWRELTSDRVSTARERLAAPPRMPAPRLDVAAVVDRVRVMSRGPEGEDATDVAMWVDVDLVDRLAVAVESLVLNASGPVRLWVVGRGQDPALADRLAGLFPELSIRVLDFSDVVHADAAGPGADCLMLPALMADVHRLVWLGVDTVVEDDVCRLARIELDGHPLAARSTRAIGAELWRVAGDDLPPELASELRRTMAARHDFGFTVFDTRVLVLDLDRMRADRFVEDLVPRMGGLYRLGPKGVLHGYVGAGRAELDPRWNALPGFEPVVDPAVVNYTHAGEPWEPGLVPEGERWHRYAARVEARGRR